jgi:DNA mismatch repair ATPase MutS
VKAFLMFRDQDFAESARSESDLGDLIQDLELTRLFEAMAGGDGFVLEVARSALLSSLSDPDTIRYRQSVLSDCLNNFRTVREIYDLAVEAIVREKKDFWHSFRNHPRWTLSGSINVLEMFLGMLRKLRRIADESTEGFQSEAFCRLFAMIRAELSDDYLAVLHEHLRRLAFRGGALISAELGNGNKGLNYVLRANPETRQGWMDRVLRRGPVRYTFELHPRDEAGHNALADIRDRGINDVANVLGQSTDHILSFFRMVRNELAFYIGCLNLHQQLEQRGAATCFPVPAAICERKHFCEGLYDVSLALSLNRQVVGNDLSADDKEIVIITGANQGGKSTFLRSIGLAQLMMQCGMFVAAKSFTANICKGVFTHYKREEDATMKSGKLDEELKRMSDIVDRLSPDSIVLFNESFAATNEREGSEIAGQVVSALRERSIKVFFVTHLYEFARSFHTEGAEGAMFLRAAREPDGTRTFKLLEGEPLPTSFGADVYEKVFGEA